MRTATIIAWLIDGLIVVYCLQLLARNSADWSGISTMVIIIALLVATIIGSALLLRKAETRGTRIAALAIAGAIPFVGGLMFLAVALIAAVAMLTGARWN
jgi:hypothetical protein